MSIQISESLRERAYEALCASGHVKIDGNVWTFPAWNVVLDTFLDTPSTVENHNGATPRSDYDPETDGTFQEYRDKRSNSSGTMFLKDALGYFLATSEFKLPNGSQDNGFAYCDAKKINIAVASGDALNALIDKLDKSPDCVVHGMIWKVPAGCKPGQQGRKKRDAGTLASFVKTLAEKAPKAETPEATKAETPEAPKAETPRRGRK